eukprot:NODE_289_length_10645_cov_0.615115.p4 type:complete len:334 gc:universal NODE_289_length_10645_cov_0.615115:5503-4502(-)
MTKIKHVNHVQFSTCVSGAQINQQNSLFLMKRISVSGFGTAIKYAQFLKKEVPKRVKDNIKQFEHLPFIVGCNPHIKSVHQNYVESYKSLSKFPQVDDTNLPKFSLLLEQLLNNHANTLINLSQGMRECTDYMKEEQTQKFIDQFIAWRISIRLLVEQYTKNGVLNEVDIADVIKFVINQLEDPFRMQYGKYPQINVSGNALIPFVASHVEYMMTELIKNSVIATIQNNESQPINIQISKYDDVVISIKDCGKGIHPKNADKIYKYSFSTVDNDHMQHMVANQTGGVLAGLGYGLGMTKVYANFFNGRLDIVSLYGHGTDAFLRLKPIKDLLV